MNQHATVIVIVSTLMLTACTAGPAVQPYAGTLPRGSSLDMSGTFALTPTGDLALALHTGCSAERTADLGLIEDAPCSRAARAAIRVVAVTPWGDEVLGTWVDPRHITFPVAWAKAKLDVLSDDAPALAARSWKVSGTDWQPTAEDARRILELVGNATQTEVQLVRGGAKPDLEITTLEVSSGALHVGDKGTLIVKIANRGPGIAYRVAATTRSSLVSLHGRRLSFGTIKPGGAKVRQLEVTVPAEETAPDTMLVLSVTEGNGFAPSPVSRRLRIAPSQAAARLTIHCWIPDHPGARPELTAASGVIVRCGVDNVGTAAAKVEVETTIADGAPSRATWKGSAANSWLSIAPGGRAALDIPLTIPRDLPIDAPAEIVITARDRPSSRTARTALVGMIRKPRLCVPGQLTRAQYSSKLAGLRDAVQAGGLTQAELDRYDAELVSCLK